MRRTKGAASLNPSVTCAFSSITVNRIANSSALPISQGTQWIVLNIGCPVRKTFILFTYSQPLSFFHPNLYWSGDNTTKVCTIVREQEYEDAKSQFVDKQQDGQCDCKPDCFSIEYECDVSEQGQYADVIYV